MREKEVRSREGKTRIPLQLIPSQPSLHSHDLPSSRRRRWSPSASESHSVSRSFQPILGKERKGRTRIQTINTAPSRGTFTLPIIGITVAVLTTCKDGEEAVEASRALSFIRGVIGSASICVVGWKMREERAGRLTWWYQRALPTHQVRVHQHKAR